MSDHLTKQAAKWFNNVETWNSFLELIPLKSAIESVWLDDASDCLRRHFTVHPCDGWEFRSWGNSRDTWWHLHEFGPGSVGIGYGWGFYLCFGLPVGFSCPISPDALKQALKQESYQPLIKAFGRQDVPIWDNALEQFGDFSFGSDFDGRLPAHELACYAGNKTDLFVAQAAAKIEAFARNPEITALLRQLNQELLTPPAIPTIRS